MDVECVQSQLEEDGQLEVGKSLAIGMTVGAVCGCFVSLLCFFAFKYLNFKWLAKNGLASTGKNDRISPRTCNQPREEQQEHLTRRDDQGSRKSHHQNRHPGPKLLNQMRGDQQHERGLKSALTTKESIDSRQTEKTDRSSYVRYSEQDDEEPTYANVSKIGNSGYDYVINYNAQGCGPVDLQSDAEQGYLSMASSSAPRWAHR